MQEIRIDRSQPLSAQPHVGHNRFHPEILPVVEVAPGEELLMETLDSLDGQIQAGDTIAALETLETGRVHPMTGPVYVKGAEPGDLLEVEYLDITPESYGVTAIVPGLGLLREVMVEPYLVHWQLSDGWATSTELPGVRIPGAPFMGIAGVAPSALELDTWRGREQRLIERGGLALPPDPAGAVPGGACGLHGLRTVPPRENGGNFDVKHLTRGARLMLPVFVEGALFSLGDGHFAQGDGEVCVTAIEMGASVVLRFRLHKGLAARRSFRAPVFSHDSYLGQVQSSLENRFLGVMGLPINAQGEQENDNLLLAAQNAVLNMMELLGERGYTREQAYVICSVAADLRIGNVVDVPNYVVSAMLPEAIFD